MSRSDIKPAHRVGVAASIYKGAATGRGAACGPSCLSASVPAAAKSPAQLPLPWGEVGPQVRVRGAGLTWIRGHLLPSPQPSPHGRGGDIAGVAASGFCGSTSGEGLAARHASSGRGAAFGPSCLSASEPAAAKSPAQLPLPWGEVGPQARVRGAGLTWIRRHLIPSSQPSPHGRGGNIAAVAASGISGSTSGEGLAAWHASSGRRAAYGSSCPSASVPAAAKSPAQLPLPWGEVGPQVRVRDAGLTWIRGHLIRSPQPSPHERGSDIAGVAASRAGRLPVRALASITAFFERASGNTLHAL